jgi:two-component system, NarL family, sensor histidine kinase DegS
MTVKRAETSDPLLEFQQEINNEVEQSRRSLSEIRLMLEQSQTELTRLTQRNAAITGKWSQVQSNFETLPREELRVTFNEALDAQQRLLVMRGQMDKLQSDMGHIQRYIGYLEKVQLFVFNEKAISKDVRQQQQQASTGVETLALMMDAIENDRIKISHEMHDGPAQVLSNFIIQAEIANHLVDIDPAKAKIELENLKTAAGSTFNRIRAYIYELRPMTLDDLGLVPTIKRFFESFADQNGIEYKYEYKGAERRLVSYLDVLLFRAVQELLANAVDHNKDYPVKLQIYVQVIYEDNLVRIIVRDNGKGFDTTQMEQTGGHGLQTLQQRIKMAGGEIEIESQPGKGCTVTFQIPAIEPGGATPEIPPVK